MIATVIAYWFGYSLCHLPPLLTDHHSWPRYLDRTRQKHAERDHRAGAQRVDRERKEAEH
jgi:hypothetical protein